MTFLELIRTPPLLHRDAEGAPTNYGLAADALEFLDNTVTSSSSTLETGAGLSTVLFSLKGADHLCIVPLREEVIAIQQYCKERGIRTDRTRFVVDRSEAVLPTLALNKLDLVLIDGRHGFPGPMIDWFYTTPALKIGGHLLIDDTQLWPCRLLRDFLEAEPEWKLKQDLGRSAVFEKLAEGSEAKEWNQQVMTLRNSQ
jgi:hypothetical protein